MSTSGQREREGKRKKRKTFTCFLCQHRFSGLCYVLFCFILENFSTWTECHPFSGTFLFEFWLRGPNKPSHDVMRTDLPRFLTRDCLNSTWQQAAQTGWRAGSCCLSCAISHLFTFYEYANRKFGARMLLGCYVMSVKPCRRAKAQDSRWLSPRAASLPLKPQEEERERERKKKIQQSLTDKNRECAPTKRPHLLAYCKQDWRKQTALNVNNPIELDGEKRRIDRRESLDSRLTCKFVTAAAHFLPCRHLRNGTWH